MESTPDVKREFKSAKTEWLDCIYENGKYSIQGNMVLEEEYNINIFEKNADGSLKRTNDNRRFYAIRKRNNKKPEIYIYVDGNRKILVSELTKTLAEYIHDFFKAEGIDCALFNCKPEIEGEIEGEKIKIEPIYSGDYKPVFKNASDCLQYKNQRMIVFGQLQSGKTMFMMAGAFNYLLLCNRSVIIVLRNSEKDKQQIIARLKTVKDELYKFLPDKIKHLFKVKIVDDKLTPEDILENHSIYVCLGNENALKKYADIVVENKKKLKEKIVMFLDEADYMDSPGTALESQLARIKTSKCMFCSFEISATVMDQLFKGKIKRENIIPLTPLEYYKSIRTFEPYILPLKSKLTAVTNGDVFENDKNLEPYIKEFSERKLNRAGGYYDSFCAEYHPIITLLRVCTCILPNLKLLAYMKKNYPEIPAMFFYAGGIIFSIRGAKPIDAITLDNGDVGEKITLNDIFAGSEEEPKEYFHFKKSAPGNVLTWLSKYKRREQREDELKEKDGSRRYPKYERIFICAGDLASRGISFGASNYSERKAKEKLWWHLSEMYIAASDKMDQPELLQLAGRLAGNYNDNIRLRLYVTKKVQKDIIKAYWLQEEIMNRSFKSNTKNLRDTITTMPILKDKIPNRSLTKKAEYTLNKVSSVSEERKAGGWSLRKYNHFDKDDKIITPISVVFEEVKAELKKTVNIREYLKTIIDPIEREFERLRLDRFPKWCKPENKLKISNFMKGLNPENEYSEKEIKDLCNKHKISHLNQLLNEKIGNSNGFGRILQKIDNDKYRLYPELIESYEKQFGKYKK